MNSTYQVGHVGDSLHCGTLRGEIISALLELDCRIFEVAQPAGSIVPYHTHEETESVIVLNGIMQFNVEEELVLVNSGEIITIRAKAIHAAAPLDNKPAKLLLAFGNLTGSSGRTVDWDEEKDEDDLFA